MPISPETRTYLGHLIAEMLAIEDLPADLRRTLSDHLSKQLDVVTLLKPEYCRHLYPILLELAELTNNSPVDAVNTPEQILESKSNIGPYGSIDEAERSEIH